MIEAFLHLIQVSRTTTAKRYRFIYAIKDARLHSTQKRPKRAESGGETLDFHSSCASFFSISNRLVSIEQEERQKINPPGRGTGENNSRFGRVTRRMLWPWFQKDLILPLRNRTTPTEQNNTNNINNNKKNSIGQPIGRALVRPHENHQRGPVRQGVVCSYERGCLCYRRAFEEAA